MLASRNSAPEFEPGRDIDQSLSHVREALVGLKFGSVALTVHDGRIVQIDVTERTRLKLP